LVIGPRRPADYSPEQGARFEVHVEKARTLVGDGALPFEAVVNPFVSESGRAGIRWVARDLKPPVLHRAAELFRDGHTVRQVADLLGVSRSEAGRLRLKAVGEGIIDAVGEDESEDLEAAVEGRFRLN
jgi:putative DNA primase/helicase